MASTRDRLLSEGMRLFGEQGYAATSVAQIEAAAGLSAGSGSLYKHFRSKEELLTAGLERLLSGGEYATPALAAPEGSGVAEKLSAVARAGLRRLDEDRDLSRLLFRGLESFPALLQRFGDEEISRVHRATTAMLAELAGERADDVDWAAVALVVQGATAHYWLLSDLFGEHPTGIDEGRFVDALVAMATALIAGTATARDESPSGP